MTTTDKWEKNITKAMKEVDQGREKKQASSVLVLPDWTAYLACMVFGFLLADLLLRGNDLHPINQDRDFSTGGKAALLIVAEDVQSYWDTHGELPDDPPSPLVSMLDVRYEKLTAEHFRLSMKHVDSTIVFDGHENTLTME